MHPSHLLSYDYVLPTWCCSFSVSLLRHCYVTVASCCSLITFFALLHFFIPMGILQRRLQSNLNGCRIAHAMLTKSSSQQVNKNWSTSYQSTWSVCIKFVWIKIKRIHLCEMKPINELTKFKQLRIRHIEIDNPVTRCPHSLSPCGDPNTRFESATFHLITFKSMYHRWKYA